MLSVIIPAYNEEAMLRRTAERIGTILTEARIPFELLFVDDGSTDQSWPIIAELAAANAAIRGVGFSRNFGKEAAIFAGLGEAKGDCLVVIDSDLQHPPEKIVEMYRLWEQGFEVVEGVKSSRGKESRWHAFAARRFYQMMSGALHMDMSRASDFKLLDRRAAEALLAMPEHNAFFRALSSWLGFKTAQVEYEVLPRAAGKTHWSQKQLFLYALANISAFSALPLQLVTLGGLVVLGVGVLASIEAIIRFLAGDAVEGFTTVIILLCFIGSMIMLSLGIIGYYLAQIHEEIKGRPRYILARRTGQSEARA